MRSSAARINLALAGVIVLIVVVAYAPAFNAGWIWDDDEWVWANPLLWSADGWVRMWIPSECPSQYFPLTYASFRLEYTLWGLEPLGFHTVNIVLHCINALLIWLLLSRLRIPGAWIAAAIWAVHPVQVESVAWVTERKNTLSTLFFILTLLMWNAFLECKNRRAGHYALAIVFTTLALLAKTTTCTLPVVMLLMVWWKKMPIDRRRLVQILPFVAIASALAWVSVVVEHGQQGSTGPEFDFSAAERFLIATKAVWFYLGKLLVPRNLSFSYPRWTLDTSSPAQYIPAAAIVVVSVLLLLGRTKLVRSQVTAAAARGAVAGLGFFLINIGPMLGFISLYTFRYTFVADHYQYVACLGPIALAAAVIAHIRHTPSRMLLVTAVLAALTALSFQQSRVYKNQRTLWEDVLAKNPNSWMAYNNLGKYLYDKGDHDKGLKLMRKSLQLNDLNAEAHYNVGAIELSLRRLDKSIEHLTKAVQIRPRYAKAHAALAVALAYKGMSDEAIEHGEKAVKLAPYEALAHLNLGVALARSGLIEEAAESFRTAVEVNPHFADAHQNLANALLRMNRFDEAEVHYRETLRLNPNAAEAHVNLAMLAYLRGDFDEAWAEVHAAQKLGLRPNQQFLEELSRRMSDPRP